MERLRRGGGGGGGGAEQVEKEEIDEGRERGCDGEKGGRMEVIANAGSIKTFASGSLHLYYGTFH